MKKAVIAMALLLAVNATAAEAPAAKVRNVAIYLYEGVEVLDFTGPAEVLESASHFVSHDAPPMKLFTVARTTDAVISQRFLKVMPEYSIADAPKIDVLVIPGGNTGPTLADAEAMAWLKKTITDAEVTLTVCTGAMPVAKLGFLDGLEVTTWYGAIEPLQKLAPNTTVKDGRRFVDNGKFITTAGVSAGIDGALHLTARLFGRRIADQTAQYMEYHWTPEPYLARSYPYLNPSADDRGRAVQLSEVHVEQKNAAGAVEVLQKLVETNAADTDAWYRLGRTLLTSKEPERAIRAFEKTVDVPSLRRSALYNLACAYGALKNRERALSYLDQAVAAGFPLSYAMEDPDLSIIREEMAVKLAKK